MIESRCVRTLVFFLLCVCLAGPARSGAVPEVAVLLSAKAKPYVEAVKGFKERLKGHRIAEYDMKGDFKRGKRILAKIEGDGKTGLIFAVGVWALKVARESDLPVVYAMAQLYPGYGLPPVERLRRRVYANAGVFGLLITWDYLVQDNAWSRGIRRRT